MDAYNFMEEYYENRPKISIYAGQEVKKESISLINE